MEGCPGNICGRGIFGYRSVLVFGNIVLYDSVQVFIDVEIQRSCCHSLPSLRTPSVPEAVQVWNSNSRDKEKGLLDDLCS